MNVASPTQSDSHRVPELHTPRLLLRRFRLDDANDVWNYLRDPEVTKFLRIEAHQHIEQSGAWLEATVKSYETGGAAIWAIFHKQDAKVIGGCLLKVLYAASKRGEIAYAIGQRYWRQGFTREALTALLDHGFSSVHLHRVEAALLPENVASCRLLENLGFTREGILRQSDFFKGAFHDMVMYSILATEWNTRTR